MVLCINRELHRCATRSACKGKCLQHESARDAFATRIWRKTEIHEFCRGAIVRHIDKRNSARDCVWIMSFARKKPKAGACTSPEVTSQNIRRLSKSGEARTILRRDVRRFEDTCDLGCAFG
jgi:hypothetical protein